MLGFGGVNQVFESPTSTNFITRAVFGVESNYGTLSDMKFQTLEDVVGKTPLVALQRIGQAENQAKNNVVLGKLEGNNPAWPASFTFSKQMNPIAVLGVDHIRKA